MNASGRSARRPGGAAGTAAIALGIAFLLLAVLPAGLLGPSAPLGEAIYRLHPPFLNTFQAGVQRHLAPWLWDDVLLPVLLLPGWLPFAAIGLLLVALGGARRRQRRAAAR
ncbi:hypothetical protein GCM10010964_40010 [Caldovatus sediminis]|uniref:Transmembrane protein n=1 Tax=Caldovatus sediminis TaxID=2041189 RepID=A0A8J2ZEF1_9PROT|nr:hypothetical protein [Caldovatus sediminis]GGG48641.1 hypothetical protein GCM10010964_40010 [Caldovatus sediminis]